LVTNFSNLFAWLNLESNLGLRFIAKATQLTSRVLFRSSTASTLRKIMIPQSLKANESLRVRDVEI